MSPEALGLILCPTCHSPLGLAPVPRPPLGPDQCQEPSLVPQRFLVRHFLGDFKILKKIILLKFSFLLVENILRELFSSPDEAVCPHLLPVCHRDPQSALYDLGIKSFPSLDQNFQSLVKYRFGPLFKTFQFLPLRLEREDSPRQFGIFLFCS